MGADASDLDLTIAERMRERVAVDDDDEETRAILMFELGGEAFAIEGVYITAVLPIAQPFFVPACPPSLEGVILHQGEIESVIDISAILGRPPLPRGGSRAILLGQTASMRSGIRVDRVVDVAQLSDSSILAAPKTVSDALRGMAARVVEREGTLVPLIDLPEVFAAWEGGEA